MKNGLRAVRLLKQEGQILGVLLIDSSGEWYAVSAKSVILATGGGGALFPQTSNVPWATGDGYALAYEAGLTPSGYGICAVHFALQERTGDAPPSPFL